MRPELIEGKLSRSVPRGLGGSNPTWLLDGRLGNHRLYPEVRHEARTWNGRGMSGNRHLPDVAEVQDREHGKLQTGWEGERNRAEGRPCAKRRGPGSGGVGVVLRAWESYVQGEGPQPVGSPSNSGTRVRTSGNAPVGCRKTVAGDEASNRC